MSKTKRSTGDAMEGVVDIAMTDGPAVTTSKASTGAFDALDEIT